MAFPFGNPNYVDYEDDETNLVIGGDRKYKRLNRQTCQSYEQSQKIKARRAMLVR